MAECICHIAGNFPVHELGIISASLRTNVETTVTEGGLVLYGAAFGDMSVTAYAPLSTGEYLDCPGRAGVSYNWDRRYECEDEETIVVHFIPRGKAKSYREGSVTNQITFDETFTNFYTFSASAASGPSTPYFYNEHQDGYGFAYSGNPIHITTDHATNPIDITDIFLTEAQGQIFPAGSLLYLQNFSWEYTPPNVPQVTYSFLFSYEGLEGVT